MKTVNLLNAVLSHLSDAQLFYTVGAAKEGNEQINVAKAILLYIADEKTNIGRIDVETEEIDDVIRRVLNL